MKTPFSASLLALVSSVGILSADPAAYDPLKVADVAIESTKMEVKDPKRDRTLPIRVYLPKSAQPSPVILFSHGLGGSCDNNPYLGNHWAKRGYVAVFIQHPGSDEKVWTDTPALRRMGALKEAASFENFLLRAKDIPAVVDALTKFNSEAGHPLEGLMDLRHVGMSGHSFGANTTQCVSGQAFAAERISFLEPRIDASVMMSPGTPAKGDPAKAFASIKIPCLLMTGTLDDRPISSTTPADRLKVFPYLNQAAAWQVVFDGATHMDFGARSLRGQPIGGTRYHRAILALTTAFWDTHLKADKSAREWLTGSGAKSVLTVQDNWEMNKKAGQ